MVFKPDGSIAILIECKAPEIEISQATFDQIAKYNMQLDANFLMVTNGLHHFYCKINAADNNYLFLQDIPDFNR